MTNKKELIRQAIDCHEELNHLILKYRIEDWLSLDLTIAQLKSVVYIYTTGKVNFRELSKALNVTPSVVTGIVDRLVQQGMVERKAPEGSFDRRVQWLVLTEKGETLLDNIRQQTIDGISQIFESMSDEDLASLVRGLLALAKAAMPYLRNKNMVTGTVDGGAIE